MFAVYIASPYTEGDAFENVRRSLVVADKLEREGIAPFAPLLYGFWHFISPKKKEQWMKLCLEWVERCDYVLRLEGESEGADEEVLHAKDLDIPVYTSLDVLIEAIRNRRYTYIREDMTDKPEDYSGDEILQERNRLLEQQIQATTDIVTAFSQAIPNTLAQILKEAQNELDRRIWDVLLDRKEGKNENTD